MLIDNFNRAGTYDLASTGWINAGAPWHIESNNAINYVTGWTDALVKAGTDVTGFKMSADLVNSQGTGLTFWLDGTGRRYRVYVYAPYVYLYYCTDNNNCGNLASGSTSGTGITLRIEANSGTRAINIFFNDVLSISFTETDTTRPNSGKAGIFSYISPFITYNYGLRIDNFNLQRQ